MDPELTEQLRLTVQGNCNIADARHGGDYGLCTYLLKMREYYRWEMGLGFSVSLGSEQLGEWLTERERQWAELEEATFATLQIDGVEYDAFDVDAINRHLNPAGLAYAGGLGHAGRPHFFLAELERREPLGDGLLIVAGRELARDLAAPPGLNRGQTLFVRRESLQRMLWEKLESWRWNRPQSPLGEAFACYDFDHDLTRALQQMTACELETVVLHEQGEQQAGELLGDDWNRMLLDLAQTPAELMARAVRDHLSDCLVTLPALIELQRPASLHFYIGNLGAMRKRLFPGLQAAYQGWCESGGLAALQQMATDGLPHWLALARELIRLHRAQGAAAAADIQAQVEASVL